MFHQTKVEFDFTTLICGFCWCKCVLNRLDGGAEDEQYFGLVEFTHGMLRCFCGN